MTTWTDVLQNVFILIYTVLLVVVSVYGLHRYALVFLWWKHKHKAPKPASRFGEMPVVTVQLPMFNERFVAQRIIRETCELDYPKDKLQIQVLDDSIDDTTEIAAKAVDEACRQGFDVELIHRTDRTGFKAGALVNGMKTAKGEFIAIFDADFTPKKDFLRNTMDYFTDPRVCVVQTRWEHINRGSSLLTEAQAIFLDGHFAIEHVSRNRSGRFMSFNGTGGIWRRAAIDDAGGWQHDTLTEDLDLSYRAQMKGWKFVFLPNETSPAELPPEMMAFKAQQFRWTKGGTQSCIKLLPLVMKSNLPLKVKAECFFHLTGFCLHIFMFLLVLLMFPAMFSQTLPLKTGTFIRGLADIGIFVLATMSGSVFYCMGQWALSGKWYKPVIYFPYMVALGVGLCVSNTKAILEAIAGKESVFVRTPKYGSASMKEYSDKTEEKSCKNKSSSQMRLMVVEFIMGLYMMLCLCCCVLNWQAALLTGPFLLMFAFGFFYVAAMTSKAMKAPKVNRELEAQHAGCKKSVSDDNTEVEPAM